MNGRQFPLGIPRHPLAQLLAMIATGVVLAAAVLMGAFVLLALLGLFAIGFIVFAVRVWWRSRMQGRGPSGAGPEPGPTKGIRYIEGEYKVIDANADTDAERRRSDPR